ncbi:hypothetical protein SAMN05421736_10876 [Evansella caseinilytica]|uniref:Uncharacterized protein n=1 Tax=Evansella caseinilytica TaxID=1503961 RepID=A0A1H3RF48_9BACI|nr:hypothetical protein [Evansella caseinilytica]SDZ24266.1 hypothetical protein SAMN05421736_10876 [Evansella caseinilytica]
MKQHIGNVGVLNLMNATPESISRIERIENVGLIIFRKETAPLVSLLNIGNIGKSLEIPEKYSLINGKLTVDAAYLQSIREPVHLLVNGTVIIDENVEPEQLHSELLHLQINGKMYVPASLFGPASRLVSHQSGADIITYQGTLPRTEKGDFTLTNSFLGALEAPQHLIIRGALHFSADLDMEAFNEKISKLEVSGLITIFERQEPYLYKKLASLTGCRVEKYPEGYEMLKKTLRLNSRSIRRFQNKKIYTKQPILFDADVGRDALTNAIAAIESSAIIVCHESVEDLVFERCSSLDAEVLTYEHGFVLIEGEETWSNDLFLALEKPMNFIVTGKLTLDEDVEDDVLRSKVAAFDILGELLVAEKRLVGSLQSLIRLNSGRLEEKDKNQTTASAAYLGNIGELTL